MVTVTESVEVMAPDVPLTVNGVDAAAAVRVAVNVRLLDVVALDGLNEAVTPVGRPVAVRATAELNPPNAAMVMVVVPLAPATMLTVLGAAVSLKPGSAVTVRAMVAFAEMVPEVAVIVRVAAPTVAVLLAVSVSVLVELMGDGLKAAVTPVGNPVMPRLAVLLKPFNGVSVNVLVPLVPCITLNVVGEAAKVKLGGTATVREIVVVATIVPCVPVTVTVTVPVVAVDVAVRAKVLVADVEVGLNVPVTPLGSPETVIATLPLKPVFGVTVMTLVALAD
jgi:hypothetical protein